MTCWMHLKLGWGTGPKTFSLMGVVTQCHGCGLHYRKFAVLEVLREDEFSPLKNAPGAGQNTPVTARLALMDLHYRQLLAAGGALVSKEGKKLPLMMRRYIARAQTLC